MTTFERPAGEIPRSDIPATRDRMNELADHLRAIGHEPEGDYLSDLANATPRLSSGFPRAETRSARMTGAKVAEIRRLKAAHPTWSQQQVAVAANVTPAE